MLTRTIERRTVWLVSVLMLGVLGLSGAAWTLSVDDASLVHQAAAYEHNGGLPVFGLPISES